MKWKEKEWVVIASCLVKKKPVEGQPESFELIDAGRATKANDAEKACWKALKDIWGEAAKRNEIQPICWVRALTKADFDKAVAKTKAEMEAKKNAPDNKEAEAASETTGQTETETGNANPLGEQAGGTGSV